MPAAEDKPGESGQPGCQRGLAGMETRGGLICSESGSLEEHGTSCWDVSRIGEGGSAPFFLGLQGHHRIMKVNFGFH